jgi:hypothetical protein
VIEINVNGTIYRAFDHIYSVSRCGEVLRKFATYRPILRPDGYVAVGRQRLLHRMVATCWLEKPSHARVVHHKNGNKADNRADNLEWLSNKEHVADRHGDVVGRHVTSDETKRKLRELRLGSKTSEATKQKQREANLRLGIKPPPRPLGYKCSPDSIAKMRARDPKNTACEVDGIAYISFADAGRALGTKLHTIRKRCLSKNFPNYRLL